MPGTEERDLDDSWVKDETTDDGDISWAAEDTPSEEEDKKPLLDTQNHSPAEKRKAEQIRHVPSTREPQLIMPTPSTEDLSSQPRRRALKVPSTSPRYNRIDKKSARSTPPTSKRSTKHHTETGSDFFDRLLSVASGFLGSLLEIVVDSLKLLKKPISWALAIYVFLIAVQFAQNLVTNSIYTALSPICRIPGASLLGLPMCQQYDGDRPRLSAGEQAADPEFDALMKVQGQFESIMEDTSTGLSLPMNMKKTETTIRDLRTLVRFSHIPSRNELVLEFDGFIETARTASYDLQKFNSHVGRGVDIVLSTARWTQRTLDGINEEQQQSAQRSLIPAFISDTVLAPFKPIKFTESRLLDQYIQHTQIVSGEIDRLIEEAQAVLRILQDLEDRLEVIHSVAVRDNIHAQGTKDEILGELWTHIGGNRAKQRQVNNQLKLLAQVTQYRRVAFNHVASTIVKLQSMGVELEELRDRVGQAGALKEAGVNQVPLAVHIENIRLGVERLEIGREKAKELEQKQHRGILDRAEENAQRDIKFID